MLNKNMQCIVVITCLLLLGAFPLTGEAQRAIKIGVLAKDGPMKCLELWDYHAYYLSETLGRDIEIRPLDFAEVEPVVSAGQIQFLLVNSGMFVSMQSRYQVRAIATMINSRKGIPLTHFGGVILVHKDSPVKTLIDITDKDVVAVAENSFGGYQMQARLLKEQGIVPSQVSFAGTHGDVIQRVLLDKGVTLVGMVRTDSLERLAEDRLSEIRVIHPQTHEGFPFLCSTILYPEWPMAALKNTELSLVREVADALIHIKDDPNDLARETLEYAKIVGWVPPANYNEVRECLRVLGVSGE